KMPLVARVAGWQPRPVTVRLHVFACLLRESGRISELTLEQEVGSMLGARCYSLQHLLARRTKDSYRIASRHKLHGCVAIVFQLGQLAKDIDVIDFARAWLMPAWNIGNMHQSNLVIIFLQLRDQVPFRYLFVEEVIYRLDVRIVYLAHDLESLGH